MIEDQHRIAARDTVETGDSNRNTNSRQGGAGDGANRAPAPIEDRPNSIELDRRLNFSV